MSNHPSATAVIRCPDDRYSPGNLLARGLDKILKNESVQSYYSLTAFGGSLELVLDDNQLTWKWKMAICQRLQIDHLIIIDHMDCGAYYYAYPGMTKEKEKAKHLENLQYSQRILSKYIPQAKIKLYLHNNNKVVFSS